MNYRGIEVDQLAEASAEEQVTLNGWTLLAVGHAERAGRCTSCYTSRIRWYAWLESTVTNTHYDTGHIIRLCLNCAARCMESSTPVDTLKRQATAERTRYVRAARSEAADWATRAMEMIYGRYNPVSEIAAPAVSADPSPNDPASWEQATEIRNGAYEVTHGQRSMLLRIWTLTISNNVELVGKRVIGRLEGSGYKPFAYLTVGGAVKMWRRYESDPAFEEAEAFANLLLESLVRGQNDSYAMTVVSSTYHDYIGNTTLNWTHTCRRCNRGLDRYVTESRTQGLCSEHIDRPVNDTATFTISNPLEVPDVMANRLVRSQINPAVVR